MDLPSILAHFLDSEAPLEPGERLLVAFSGGPDSTALLWGLSRLRPAKGFALAAVHLDHGMDDGSAARARDAARLAAAMGVDFVEERREVPSVRRLSESTESLEAAARRVRYGFLEEVRRRLGARWVATAHHLDDQAETVLLRLLSGSGLEGLAGIRPVHGRVIRPLLTARRAELRDTLEARAPGLTPVDDPTNLDLHPLRNRIRHRLLPELTASFPDLPERLARLAERTRRAGKALDARLAEILSIEPLEAQSLGRTGAAADRRAFEALPAALRPFALAALHRRAGAPYPPGAEARSELDRQLASATHRVGCDCGDGWRWEAGHDRLILQPIPQRACERVPDFTYTLEIPGEVEIPEISLRIRLSRSTVEPWMFQGSPDRAALALPLEPGARVTVRNRRPGDRIHPLGARGSRRLKEVFIDRQIPRQQRDLWPLLCVGKGSTERIAWVPGVTIDQQFRLEPEDRAAIWLAEVMR